MARIRSATKQELKACREDPRQLDLTDFLQSLPDQALLDEVARRYPLGHQFAAELNEAFAPELEPHEVLEEVRDTLDANYFGGFKNELRKLIAEHEEDED